jgi:hypothetical protein
MQKRNNLVGSTYQIKIPEINIPRELKALSEIKMPYIPIRIRK